MNPQINDSIPEILASSKRIAVIGLSGNPARTSYGVTRIAQSRGYEIIPVNPVIDQWNGLPSYSKLADVPGSIDIVNVFRRSEFVSDIVDEAIRLGAKTIWTQLGVVDYDAADRAIEAGLRVVMDRCLKIELQSFR